MPQLYVGVRAHEMGQGGDATGLLIDDDGHVLLRLLHCLRKASGIRQRALVTML
jgi:hypothetical protein